MSFDNTNLDKLIIQVYDAYHEKHRLKGTDINKDLEYIKFINDPKHKQIIDDHTDPNRIKNLEIGTTYSINTKDNDSLKVTLVHVETFPATGMPGDFIFEYVEGPQNLIQLNTAFIKNRTGVDVLHPIILPQSLINVLIQEKQIEIVT